MEVAANRGMNISIAVIALLFFLPIMALVALAIWCQDRGPVFFAHKRIGRDGRKFPCLKFRSMAIDAQERLQDLLAKSPEARAEWERDHKLRNDPRITGLGLFLRKSSLDELPQLLNVISGEMSLIGPRPHAQAHDKYYTVLIANYDLRQMVKPGITGWAQINGHRGETPTLDAMRARVDLDIWYACNASLALDLQILLRTPLAVFSQRNAH